MIAVDVWRVRLSPPEAHDWLSVEERRRAEEFMQPADGRRFAACRTALRGILGARCGLHPSRVVLTQPPGHRPTSFPPLTFSVSHSGDGALIAVAPGGILGIDMEQRSFRNLDWLATQLSPAERRQGALDPLHRWVCKEAALKATGYGLALEPSGVVVPEGLARRILVTRPIPRFWHLSTFSPWPGAVAALVTDRAHKIAFHDFRRNLFPPRALMIQGEDGGTHHAGS